MISAGVNTASASLIVKTVFVSYQKLKNILEATPPVSLSNVPNVGTGNTLFALKTLRDILFKYHFKGLTPKDMNSLEFAFKLPEKDIQALAIKFGKVGQKDPAFILWFMDEFRYNILFALFIDTTNYI